MVKPNFPNTTHPNPNSKSPSNENQPNPHSRVKDLTLPETVWLLLTMCDLPATDDNVRESLKQLATKRLSVCRHTSSHKETQTRQHLEKYL